MTATNLSFAYVNTSDEEVYYPTLKQPIYMIVIYSFAYTVVFVTALVGNIMVMVVVSKNHSMHTVTNYFLVNLAVADILVAIFCVPVNLMINLCNSWQLGAFMCKLTPYLQGVSVCASVNTLAAIALDRYFAICKTLEIKIDTRKSRLILLGIWITALGIMVPWLVYFNEVEYRTPLQLLLFCFEKWPDFQIQQAYYMGVIFICCYSMPLAMILVCYLLIGIRVWRRDALGVRNSSTTVIQRSKVKVIKMLAVVCTLFACSWLPLYGLKFWKMIEPRHEEKSEENIIDEIIFPIAQWLGSSNCCVNPVIYCFFSKKFRKGFRDLLSCCDWKMKYVPGSPDTRETTLRCNSRDSHSHYRV